MGSSRLPGKVMLPLDGAHVLEHDIRRVASADNVHEVVVATSDKKQDDIIARYAKQEGASVYRGSEDDVLGRMYGAASEYDADIIVRITADCPLVSPELIDCIVNKILDERLSRVSGTSDFPLGIAAEAFTLESFNKVDILSSKSYEREHVTPYYRENPDEFKMAKIEPPDVFSENWLTGNENFRLTLDEADDYELFCRVYEEIPYESIIDTERAIEYVNRNKLYKINGHVEQKSIRD
jgi:spore coat polysaccharide biosynthesis protein SpsF